jgi:hypothetical protein
MTLSRNSVAAACLEGALAFANAAHAQAPAIKVEEAPKE